MASETIIDGKLFIRLERLGSGNLANLLFPAVTSNLARLSNLLLLYERIAIPTYDFGIIPILISWFGLEDFERALDSDAFVFLRRQGRLIYQGGGIALKIQILSYPENRSHEWWEEATYLDIPSAIELQLKHASPFISKKRRAKLVDSILTYSHDVNQGTSDYIDSVIEESYDDILNSELMLSLVSSMVNISKKRIDLRRLGYLRKNESFIYDPDLPIQDPLSLILNVADMNMQVLMSATYGRCDFSTFDGAQLLLESKLRRAGMAESSLDKLIQLLELNSMPDIGAAVAAGELSLQEIWAIRIKRVSRQFRQWFRTADTGDARELERMYVKSLGKTNLTNSLPVKLLRFAITNLASVIFPVGGIAIDAIDTFFVDNWLQGYSPRLFLDELQRVIK